MYYPKPHIWLNEYDPLYVLLRAVHRRDYQSSVDRFTQFIRSSQNQNSKDDKKQRNKQLWPPFRLPLNLVDGRFADPKKLLYSKVLQGFIFTILYRSLYTNDVSEQVLALTSFLLQLSLVNNKPENDSPAVKLNSVEFAEEEVDDLAFEEWFNSNWVLENMNIIIQDIIVYEKRPNSKETNCILFSDKLGTEPGVNDENLDDQGLSVEEMEVDFLYSNDDNVNNTRYDDEYMMNDVEHLMNERREYFERIEEMPQLPSSNVPLALTSGNLSSGSSESSTTTTSTTANNTQPAQSNENLAINAASSSSSSNSLSSSSSAPLLAILSASSSATSPTASASNQIATIPTASSSNNNTPPIIISNPSENNTQNAVSLITATNNSNQDQQQQSLANAIKMSRRNHLRLNTLSIQNLPQIRSTNNNNSNANANSNNWVSGPSTSPQTRTVIPEIPKTNWVNLFKNNPTTMMSPSPSTSNADNQMSSNVAQSSASTSTNNNLSSLPFLRRIQSQNRRSKYNRKRCPLDFSKQYHLNSKYDLQASGAENQMNICELIKALPSSNGNLIKRKITVNESLISLLLKLHSKLSGKQDSYQFDENRVNDINNRIGDATHFIEQILDLYCNLNVSTGRQAVQTWKVKLWPFNYAKSERENLDATFSGATPAGSPSNTSATNLDTDSPSSNLGKLSS